jgi:hypothetical protein
MYGEGKTRGKCSELLIEATTNQQACAAIVLRDEAVDRSYLKLWPEGRRQTGPHVMSNCDAQFRAPGPHDKNRAAQTGPVAGLT